MIGWLLAAQIAVVAHAPDTAAACAPFEVTVAARARGTVAPRIGFPATGPVQLLRSTVASRMEPDGTGTPFMVSEGTFLVAVAGRGPVRLPAVTATIGAQRGVAPARTVMLHELPEDDEETRVLVRARLDDGHGAVDADTVFVGQQVDYVVDVQLNAAARRRLRRNPTFFPPDMPAVLAYDVDVPPPRAASAPACFRSLTYRRALFPLFPGATAIPPAVLTYAVPVSTSFFSREEPRELRTDSVHIVALEAPAAGRPADYAGAVGRLRSSARIASATARMGDPVVLTLRLEGAGNVKLLPRPAFSVAWASVADGAERVEVDSTTPRVTGAKEFDWLLTPRRAGRQEIPAVRYPVFDPARVAYDVIVTQPLALDVAPASLASSDTAVAARAPIRTALREERPPPMTERPAYWLLLALAPVPAAVRRVRRVRRRNARALTAARRLQLAAASGGTVVAREMRRLYLDALRERVASLRPATARNPLARQLRRAGVTEATADAAEALLERLDQAAFAGGGTTDAVTLADAARVAAAVDAQAVRHSSGRAWPAVSVLVAAAMSASLLAAMPDGATRTFADGVRAYQGGDVRLATRLFARTAARAPRAVDAWANLGVAALASGDTARASAGWQRALRLDPLDAEVRDRLGELDPSLEIGDQGFVPPVPVGLAAGTALALWLAAWLALALPPRRRPSLVRPMAGGALAAAVVVLAATLELRDRFDARGLGALRASATLLDSPLAGAAGTIRAAAGEVGLLGAREGAWVRISFDGTRAGWVPVAAVLPLDEAASD